eukprot:m.191049 g.191049  ORF g.191049 m.191049 type:complete len:755 (-) comp32421_c8_seq1:245-2509(-)
MAMLPKVGWGYAQDVECLTTWRRRYFILRRVQSDSFDACVTHLLLVFLSKEVAISNGCSVNTIPVVASETKVSEIRHNKQPCLKIEIIGFGSPVDPLYMDHRVFYMIPDATGFKSWFSVFKRLATDVGDGANWGGDPSDAKAIEFDTEAKKDDVDVETDNGGATEKNKKELKGSESETKTNSKAEGNDNANPSTDLHSDVQPVLHPGLSKSVYLQEKERCESTDPSGTMSLREYLEVVKILPKFVETKQAISEYNNLSKANQPPTNNQVIGRANLVYVMPWNVPARQFWECVVDDMYEGDFAWTDFYMVDDDIDENCVKAAIGKLESLSRQVVRVVVALQPWQSPLCLRSSWCLLVISYAIHTSTPLKMVLPDTEKAGFRVAVLQDNKRVMDTLLDFEFEAAQAPTKAVAATIEQAVAEMPGGDSEVIELIKERLWHWVFEQAVGYVEGGGDGAEYAQLCHQVVQMFDFHGEKACRYYFKSLAIAAKYLAADHPILAANTYSTIGQHLVKKKDYENALELFHKSRSIQEKHLGEKHQDTVTTYFNLGTTFDALGRVDDALEFHFKAINFQDSQLETDHPTSTSSYMRIGANYSNLGDYDRALQFYFKALAMQEQMLGTKQPYIATNSGMLYKSKSDYDRAADFTNRAMFYKSEGKVDKALEFYHKALEITEKQLGLDHPDTATSFNNVGVGYFDKNDYDKALEYFLKALGSREKSLGKKHPDTISSYKNIANLYGFKGNKIQARRWLAKLKNLM